MKAVLILTQIIDTKWVELLIEKRRPSIYQLFINQIFLWASYALCSTVKISHDQLL